MSTVNILVDGKSYPAQQITVVESITLLYHYVRFTVYGRVLKRKIKISVGRPETYVIITEGFRETVYEYTAVPESTFKLLQSTFNSFTGNGNLSTLCSKVGIPMGKAPATNSSYWYIPAFKLENLLRYIGNYVDVSNGGGPRAFINLKGELELVDLKSVFDSKKTYTIWGDVVDDEMSTDWQLAYAGNFQVVHSKLAEFKTKEVTLDKSYSKSRLWVNDTTGHTADMQIRGASNQFWKKYYTSRKVTVSLRGGDNQPCLGDLIKLQKLDNAIFIVGSRTTQYDGGGEIVGVQLELFTHAEDS